MPQKQKNLFEQDWEEFNNQEASAIIQFEAGDAWHPSNTGHVYEVSYRCETCGFTTNCRREIWSHTHIIPERKVM